jgi:hypothetical protein
MSYLFIKLYQGPQRNRSVNTFLRADPLRENPKNGIEAENGHTRNVGSICTRLQLVLMVYIVGKGKQCGVDG